MYIFVFFKQKTAYEMRISDWSSDVCSSDLPVAGPGFRDGADEFDARGIHRHLLEPAVGGLGHDHHEFGRIVLVQPFGDGGGDLATGEILILEIDKAPGARDEVEIEALDLADFGEAVIFGAGARDRHLDVSEIGEIGRAQV